MDRCFTARRPSAPAVPAHDPAVRDPSTGDPAGGRPARCTPAATRAEPRARRGWDVVSVLKNAGVCGVAIGSTYGTMAALNGFLRADPRVPRRVKVLAGLLPAVGVAASPWVEDALRAGSGTAATYPVIPSLEHDAVASAGLLGCHHLGKRIPALNGPAGTLAGAALSVTRSALASVVAGAASELSGQASHVEAEAAGIEPPPGRTLDPRLKSAGRGLTQLPAAGLFAVTAARGQPVSPDLAARVVTGGWAFRRVLTPGEQWLAQARPPGAAAGLGDPAQARTFLEATAIPPA